MNTCSKYRDDLSAYIDGELTWDEREAIEEHIASCPACASELAALKHTQELCQQIEDVPTPSDLTSSIMTKVREQRNQQIHQRRRWYYPLGAVAAVLLVFMVGIQVLPVQLGWQHLTQGLPGMGSMDMPQDDLAWDPAPAPEGEKPGMGIASEPGFTDMGTGIRGEGGQLTLPRDTGLDERMIVKTGEMTADVHDGQLEVIEGTIVELVEELGGYIENSSHWTEANGRRRTSLVIRVPAEEFSRVLYAFDDEVAKVVSRSAGSHDVSEDYMDLSARLRNREVQEQRLLDIMEKAENVDEIMQVENELVRVRSEIERLIGRMRHYESVATLATLRIQLREAGSAMDDIANWWDDIRDAFVGSVRYLALGIAFFVPYLLFIVLLWMGIRWVRRSKQPKE